MDKFLQRERILTFKIVINHKTECRGATNPQSELGYIVPDSLFSVLNKIKMPLPAAPDGYVKWRPSAVIFSQKCGCWHFENAIGREIPAKPRPVDSNSGLRLARCRLTMPSRLFQCLLGRGIYYCLPYREIYYSLCDMRFASHSSFVSLKKCSVRTSPGGDTLPSSV